MCVFRFVVSTNNNSIFVKKKKQVNGDLMIPFFKSVGVAIGGVVLGSFRMPTSDSQVGLQRSSVLVLARLFAWLFVGQADATATATRHRYVCRSCALLISSRANSFNLAAEDGAESATRSIDG